MPSQSTDKPKERTLEDYLAESNRLQKQILDSDIENQKIHADYLKSYNKNLLRQAWQLRINRFIYWLANPFDSNKRKFENRSVMEFTVKEKIVLVVEVIGFIASILGIIAFYLDYLR